MLRGVKCVGLTPMPLKNSAVEKKFLNFDFSFNPRNVEKWKLAIFKRQWGNLEL